MQTRRLGNGWILATDSNWVDTSPKGGNQERSMANMREEFKSWTGDAWGEQAAHAKIFETEKAATDYMKQHAGALGNTRK